MLVLDHILLQTKAMGGEKLLESIGVTTAFSQRQREAT